MADKSGREGLTVGFEPVPETFQYLSENANFAKRNSLRIDARRLAVSSKPGKVAIKRRTHSTLHEVEELHAGHDEEGAREWVSATTLDEVINDIDRDIVKLLKVDVEGHELAVVSGAERSLRESRFRNIVVEVTPGPHAIEIQRRLEKVSSHPLCWLDDAWRSISLADLPRRTDVWFRV
jgi:FkbM family methyltransferase